MSCENCGKRAVNFQQWQQKNKGGEEMMLSARFGVGDKGLQWRAMKKREKSQDDGSYFCSKEWDWQKRLAVAWHNSESSIQSLNLRVTCRQTTCRPNVRHHDMSHHVATCHRHVKGHVATYQNVSFSNMPTYVTSNDMSDMSQYVTRCHYQYWCDIIYDVTGTT